MENNSMSIPMICIALLALLVFVLGAKVTMARATSGTFYGGAEDPEGPLYQAQRAHGNAIEYAPILAIAMLALAQSAQPTWVLVFMVVATAFRYLHAAGILFPGTMAKANPMRFFGAVGTYVSGMVLGCALLIQAS